MKRVVIKIDKLKSRAETTALDEAASQIEIDTQQDMADIVNNWISERRANRLVEKAFSDERISAWKTSEEFS